MSDVKLLTPERPCPDCKGDLYHVSGCVLAQQGTKEFPVAASLAPAPDTRTLAEVRASIERDRLRVEAIRDEAYRQGEDEQGLWHLRNTVDSLNEARSDSGYVGRWIPRLATREQGR